MPLLLRNTGHSLGKIDRPVLQEVFPRKRLFALLDKLRRLPILWVSGPGGCGKTTLVSSYLDGRKIPCLWYQIEEGDKDPATMERRIDLQQTWTVSIGQRRSILQAVPSSYMGELPNSHGWTLTDESYFK